MTTTEHEHRDVEAQLRRDLHVTATTLPVPPPPLQALLADGRAATARLRRRRWSVAAGVAAAAALVAVVAQIGVPAPVQPAPPAGPDRGADRDTVTRTLEELPLGPGHRFPIAQGGSIYVDGESVWGGVLQPTLRIGGGTVAASYEPRNGAVHLLRLDSRTRTRVGEATGPAVVSVDDAWLAWPTSGNGGHTVVEVAGTDTGAVVERLRFPVTGSCCDNPFQVLGIDGSGRVFVYVNGDLWVAPVTGDRAPRMVQGLNRRWPLEVTADGLLLDASNLGGGPRLELGWVAEDARYLPRLSRDARHGTVSPDGRRFAYQDRSGRVWVMPDLEDDARRLLQVPEEQPVTSLLWESADALLVELETADGDTPWVRCYVGDGACVLAMWLPEPANIARR